MKLTHSQTAHLCRGLSALLHGGISLADGLFLLAQEESGVLRETLDALGRRMDQGAQLSEAMEESGVFSRHVSGMVRIGEQSGRLEETLSALAEFSEERCRTGRQIKNALTYPCLILLLMLAVLAVLLIKVMPVFDQVYASLGSRLTGAAAGLLHLGQWLERALPVLLVLLAAAGALALLYRFCLPFREKVTAVCRRKFGDRGVVRKFNNARFARALAMGFGSGLTLEEGLELAQQLLSDIPGAAARCDECARLLETGESLSEALRKTHLLPPSQSRMLSVGMRGGNADQILETIADALEEDARQSLEDAVSRIEPAMVLVCSLLVGGILLCVMLPLVNIMSTLGGSL